MRDGTYVEPCIQHDVTFNAGPIVDFQTRRMPDEIKYNATYLLLTFDSGNDGERRLTENICWRFAYICKLGMAEEVCPTEG